MITLRGGRFIVRVSIMEYGRVIWRWEGKARQGSRLVSKGSPFHWIIVSL